LSADPGRTRKNIPGFTVPLTSSSLSIHAVIRNVGVDTDVTCPIVECAPHTIKEGDKLMNKLLITTATLATLFAGAASAQSMNNNSGWNGQRAMTERNVSMQRDRAWTGSNTWRNGMSGSTYDSGAFKSQEVWPQSPPTGS
jgi:hypothetical protein